MRVTVCFIVCTCLVGIPRCFSFPNQDKKTQTDLEENMSTDENVWPIWGYGLGYPGTKGGYYPQSWFPPPGSLNPYYGPSAIPGGMLPGGTFSGPIPFPQSMIPQSGGSSPYGGNGGYNM